MFGLGMPEMVVIGGIALLIFGPRQLPKMGKALGETITSMRNIGKEIEKSADEA